ncbi:MAG: YicC/YloC family endoribonuclease [Planctomycetota bacterium]|nr:YicC/YloC family endoribonuclease [Planctomycetota bacterium]
MTGFGAATHQSDDVLFTVEVRSVNNRYLKIVSKLPDTCGALEGQVERAVRERIRRGTVSVFARINTPPGVATTLTDERLMAEYAAQFREIAERLELSGDVTLETLLAVPGVIRDGRSRLANAEELWPCLERALQGALEQLAGFRLQEGATIESDLRHQCGVIATELEAIRAQAPRVADSYRQKLLDRVGDVLDGTAATVSESDVIREVSLFADRCDINEEISRMDAHLEQFEQILDSDSSQGRKLDFLGQEMFRETNTIGSKANDVEIAHRVVEIKLALDRIRENIQNVE